MNISRALDVCTVRVGSRSLRYTGVGLSSTNVYVWWRNLLHTFWENWMTDKHEDDCWNGCFLTPWFRLLFLVMSSPPDGVNDGICFRAVYLFVCSFFRTALVTTISCEWLEHCRLNLMEYSPAPNGSLVRFWRSKVKVTAGHRHV